MEHLQWAGNDIIHSCLKNWQGTCTGDRPRRKCKSAHISLINKGSFQVIDALLLPVLFSPFMWYLEPDYIKLELVLSGLAKFSTKFGSRINEKVKKVLVISHGYASPLLVTLAFLWKKRIGRGSLMVCFIGTKG